MAVPIPPNSANEVVRQVNACRELNITPQGSGAPAYWRFYPVTVGLNVNDVAVAWAPWLDAIQKRDADFVGKSVTTSGGAAISGEDFVEAVGLFADLFIAESMAAQEAERRRTAAMMDALQVRPQPLP